MREYFRKGLPEQDALRIALLALYNAAEEDVGTGGPDVIRGIYPTAKLVNVAGIIDVEEQRIADIYSRVMADRRKEA
jgi:proteasome beta subunit